MTSLIRRVSERGCRFALDDFGTGYSSFAYLKELPVDFLKIDGVFVRDLARNPLSEAIVASVARIAEVMGAATIAEHVEDDAIVSRLRALGIDYGQGYGIGKPAPLDEVLDELRSSDDGPVAADLELVDTNPNMKLDMSGYFSRN